MGLKWNKLSKSEEKLAHVIRKNSKLPVPSPSPNFENRVPIPSEGTDMRTVTGGRGR